MTSSIFKNLGTSIVASVLAMGCATKSQRPVNYPIVDRGQTLLTTKSGQRVTTTIFKNSREALTLRFNTDSYALSSDDRKSLMGFLRNIDQTDLDRLVVVGFADPRGASSYNEQLSQKRANVVAEWLLGKGVRAEEYDIDGLGELFAESHSNSRIVQVRVIN